VRQAEKYPWSSYPVHALGVVNELVDPLVVYEQLSPRPKDRQRRWAKKVHLPLEEAALAQIRRSTATGLPYGDEGWVKRLAKKLALDLTIRPRGRSPDFHGSVLSAPAPATEPVVLSDR